METGDVLVRDMTESDLDDPGVKRWLEKVVVRPDESLSRYACQLAVKLENGSTVSASDAGAEGDPADPLKWDAVIRKFARMVELPITDPAIVRLATLVDSLENASTTDLILWLLEVRNRSAHAGMQ
jgi:2-methylcitrate dehydratase PrpD